MEPGESRDCLRREVREELGPVEVTDIEYIGTYRDQAAGDLSKIVQIALYQGTLAGNPKPNSEIAELVWFGPNEDHTQLSPSIANKDSFPTSSNVVSCRHPGIVDPSRQSFGIPLFFTLTRTIIASSGSNLVIINS